MEQGQTRRWSDIEQGVAEENAVMVEGMSDQSNGDGWDRQAGSARGGGWGAEEVRGWSVSWLELNHWFITLHDE
jgi:hypothetical protein